MIAKLKAFGLCVIRWILRRKLAFIFLCGIYAADCDNAMSHTGHPWLGFALFFAMYCLARSTSPDGWVLDPFPESQDEGGK